MIEWYQKVVFQNYANFKGRARRSEFWYYALATFIISIILNIVDRVFGLTYDGVSKNGLIGSLYSLLVFIPGLAVSVRRLHDIGKSGWLLLVSYGLIFLCVIGLFVSIFLSVQTDFSKVWMAIPIMGMIAIAVWMLVLFATDGNEGKNKYGLNPKNIFDEDDEIDEIGTSEA